MADLSPGPSGKAIQVIEAFLPVLPGTTNEEQAGMPVSRHLSADSQVGSSKLWKFKSKIQLAVGGDLRSQVAAQ